MTIQNFDKQNLGALRIEMQAALDAVAAKHGIKLQLHSMTYDPLTASFRVPLVGTAASAGDLNATRAVELAALYSDIDASAPSTNPRTLGAVLKEYRSKSRSKPWVYEQQGKLYVTSDQGLKMMWPRVVRDAPRLQEVDNLIAS